MTKKQRNDLKKRILAETGCGLRIQLNPATKAKGEYRRLLADFKHWPATQAALIATVDAVWILTRSWQCVHCIRQAPHLDPNDIAEAIVNLLGLGLIVIIEPPPKPAQPTQSAQVRLQPKTQSVRN